MFPAEQNVAAALVPLGGGAINIKTPQTKRVGLSMVEKNNTYLWNFGIFCINFSGSPSSSSKCSEGSTMAGQGVLERGKTKKSLN